LLVKGHACSGRPNVYMSGDGVEMLVLEIYSGKEPCPKDTCLGVLEIF
jgi:hypothetical protein